MILEFEQVTGEGRGFRLENVSFSLPQGYIMGLAGKNGAGKTTLMDYIMNPQRRYRGTIRVDGADIRENPQESRGKIGFVSENNHFFMEQTAAANAELLGFFYKDWDMDLFHAAMKKMELSERKNVGSMSRGEQMKFQMAFAMAHRPVLYLLDEVTAGMDPVFRIDFFKLLGEVVAEECASVLMTSHIEEEMHRKMDYLGIIEQGRLISFGESEAV